MNPKSYLYTVFLFLGITTFAQEKLPTIRATSKSVDIRVGDDYYAKGGWHLNPEANPDVFSIGSKWNYDSLRVSFITDIDSISYDVQPGHKYDFIVLLNEETPCYIQIATVPNPVFMRRQIIIPVFSFLLVMLIFLLIKPNYLPAKFLLLAGVVTPIIFWVITFVGGYIHGNYNHATNVISGLGAIGSKAETFISSSFVVLSVFSLLFSHGFYRASRKLNISPIPTILSFSMPLLFLWAAVFPLGNEFHRLIGPTPLFLILGTFLSFILWRNKVDFLRLRWLSMASCLLMMLLFLRFIRPFGFNYEGMIQRFFYLGWSLWNVSLGILLSSKIEAPKTNLQKN